MGSSRNFIYFIRNISRKHRLSLRRQRTDREVWYMHISPLELIGALVALVLLLFIIVLTLAAHTRILDMVPGYKGNRIREDMVRNIIRVDSIERRIDELQDYYANVALIMDGKTPITRNVQQAGDSLRSLTTEAVPPNAADSALRLQLEGSGPYSLESAVGARHTLRGAELMPPVRGVVATHFNPRESRYGVGIATATNQQILAVDAGTVILSVWSPEEGYTIQIQHSGDVVSTYRHSAQSLTTVGSRVRAGQVIGSTGEGISGEGGKRVFEFELWQSGAPVDPESYIIF